MGSDPYRTNDRRVIPWLLLGLLVLFGGLYVVLYQYTADRIPRNTTVNGIEVGGLRPAAAERKLADGLGGRAAEPLVVTAMGQRAVIRPSTAGLSVDVPSTLDRARSESGWDPRSMWDYVVGGTAHEAAVSIDAVALEDAIASFAERVDRPAVEGSVSFRADLATARYPERGIVVDRAVAADAVRTAFLRDNGPQDVVALPTREDRATVDADAVSRAMEQFANPAMSEPVAVRLARRTVTIAPEDYSSALSVEPVGSQLRPQVDRDALLRLVRPRLRSALLRPQDASVQVVAGKPRIVGGRVGRTFDPNQLADAFLPALTRTGAERTLVVRVLPLQPEVTVAEVRRLRITQRVSAFTTRFPYAAYRNVNLGRAADLVNGTILEPGQTFSLNDTVGERTAANGFTRGYVISDGIFVEDWGGGVSQVASTLFNAAFFAGLEDVEHKAHSFYIDRYPIGREATVVWPDIDLKFKNATPYGVLINASIDKAGPGRRGTMRVSMWSTKHWDISTERSGRYRLTPPGVRRLSGPRCVPHSGTPGFDIDVYRLWRRHGSDELVRRERMRTTYVPADRVTCG